MCCLSFNADVILANLFGSPKCQIYACVKLDTIKNYCDYLEDIISGYKFFNISNSDIKNAIDKYPMYFSWENNQVRCKKAPPRERFNIPYPPEVAKKMQKAADVVWMASVRV